MLKYFVFFINIINYCYYIIFTSQIFTTFVTIILVLMNKLYVNFSLFNDNLINITTIANINVSNAGQLSMIVRVQAVAADTPNLVDFARVLKYLLLIVMMVDEILILVVHVLV